MTIETEAENKAAIMLAESLEHRQRTPEEDALLELLIILIEKFEDASYPLPNVEPDRMLLHLMESRNMKQEELVGVIGSRGVVSEIINGERSISKAQAKALGQLFHVSPSLFTHILHQYIKISTSIDLRVPIKGTPTG
jgi:HTH-type transcriptional regulator / antitoxin HigA